MLQQPVLVFNIHAAVTIAYSIHCFVPVVPSMTDTGTRTAMFTCFHGHIYILLSMHMNQNACFVHPQIVRNADIQISIPHLTSVFVAQQG